MTEKKPGLDEMAAKNKTFIEVDGKKYTCSPPEIFDHAEFLGELRAEKLSEAAGHMKVLKDAGIADELCMQEYDRRVDKAEVDDTEMLVAMNSLRGARFYFGVCAGRNHPELTKEAVIKLVTEDNWRTVIRQLNKLKPEAKNVVSGKGKKKT